MRERLENLKRVAEQARLEKVLDWIKQAEYMLDTYKGTAHETEVNQMIESTLNSIDLA